MIPQNQMVPMKVPLPPPAVALPPGAPPPNPSVIATFLSLDPASQQKFATINPQAYAQLYYAINQQQPQLQIQSQHQPQQQQYFPQQPQKNKKKTIKVSKPKDPISESDNFHSSDEELNIRSPHPTTPPRATPHPSLTKYLPIDFRNSLTDITPNDSYVLNIPPCQIREIELEACIINSTDVIEREPYIYLSIQEIPGDYQLIGGDCVFGKLLQEKTVNEFIFYRPENCRKTLRNPVNLDKLTVSFLNYDKSPISIGKLQVKDLSNGKTYCKLRTRGAHNLTTGDSVNISYRANNRITVEALAIIDILSQDVLITEPPVHPIVPEDKCAFERTQIKCSLTFRVS
jgi:hypothetical protein